MTTEPTAEELEAAQEAIERDPFFTNEPQPRAYKSCCQWPAGIIYTQDNTSTDDHDTLEQAEAVCAILRRDGLGGNGKVFPVKTWTEPVY